MSTPLPTLKFGDPLFSYDGKEILALVTEEYPIALLAVDSGLELVFEPGPVGVDGYACVGTIRARRRHEAPQVHMPTEQERADIEARVEALRRLKATS